MKLPLWVKDKKHLEELLQKKNITYDRIVEDGNIFWIYKDRNTVLDKVVKLRSLEETLNALKGFGFPKRFLLELPSILKNPVKNITWDITTQYLKNKVYLKKGLGLIGSVGTGKTLNIIRIAVSLYARHLIKEPVFICLGYGYDRDITEKAKMADFIVLDDVNKNISDWSKIQAREIVMMAYDEGKKIFLTSNNTKEELFEKVFDPHIASRLEEMMDFVVVKDKDLRKLKTKSY